MKLAPIMIATVFGQKAMENGYPREAVVPSPNPHANTGIDAAVSDHVDCLKNGHELCIKRADGSKSCVASNDARLSDSTYACTNKYTDKIFKYSMINTALSGGECPKSIVFQEQKAAHEFVFPKGKQACTVVIKDHCGAPAFKVDL